MHSTPQAISLVPCLLFPEIVSFHRSHKVSKDPVPTPVPKWARHIALTGHPPKLPLLSQTFTEVKHLSEKLTNLESSVASKLL